MQLNFLSRLSEQRQRLSVCYLYPLADCMPVPSLGMADDPTAYTGLPCGHIRVVPNPIVTPKLARLAAEHLTHPWFAGDGPPVIFRVGNSKAIAYLDALNMGSYALEGGTVSRQKEATP